MSRTPRRVTAILGLVFAGFLAAFVVGISPHLVHHLFDDDHGKSECPFASVGERQHGLTTVSADTFAPAERGEQPSFVAPIAPPSSVHAPSSPRAPPTTAA